MRERGGRGRVRERGGRGRVRERERENEGGREGGRERPIEEIRIEREIEVDQMEIDTYTNVEARRPAFIVGSRGMS